MWCQVHRRPPALLSRLLSKRLDTELSPGPSCELRPTPGPMEVDGEQHAVHGDQKGSDPKECQRSGIGHVGKQDTQGTRSARNRYRADPSLQPPAPKEGRGEANLQANVHVTDTGPHMTRGCVTEEDGS